MNQIDRILQFAFNHHLMIIEILFAVILAIAVIWLFANLTQESASFSEDKNIKDIESALKRVLGQTTSSVSMTTAAQAGSLIRDDDDIKNAISPKTAASSTAPAAGAPAGGAAVAGAAPVVNALSTLELEKLKSENELKAKKLAELEKALSTAKEELEKAKINPAAPESSAAGASNNDELSKKIKELESRLAEYEIIEDDIANLSLYKEENMRLKNELQKMGKGTVPGAPAPTPVAAPAPVAEPPVAVPVTPAAAPAESVAVPLPTEKGIDPEKLIQEVNTLAQAPPAAPGPPADEKDTGQKLIEEFESFMKGSGG